MLKKKIELHMFKKKSLKKKIELHMFNNFNLN
jgi:hypothetical protein